MAQHTFRFGWDEEEQTITVENQTWNEEVAQQYAAYHLQDTIGQTVDPNQIRIEEL